jgi:hypothetical protein
MIVRLLLVICIFAFSIYAYQKQTTAKPKAQDKTSVENQKTKRSKTGDLITQGSKSSKQTRNSSSKIAKKSSLKANRNATSKSDITKNTVQKETSQRSSSKNSGQGNSRNIEGDSASMDSRQNADSKVTTLLISNVSVPLRNAPVASAGLSIALLKLGERVKLLDKKSGWYRVECQSNSKRGWIAAEEAEELNNKSAEKLYLQIANKNYTQEMSFSHASELIDFISSVVKSVKSPDTQAELELIKLLALRRAISSTPTIGGSYKNKNNSPYKEFLERYKEYLVHDEPSGSYMVKSEAFWKLCEKYKDLPIADRIAWEAAQNPLPGECELYIVCNLYYFRMTVAEYLRLYPNGSKAKEALKNLSDALESIIKSRSDFQGPTDVTDKAEFFNLIAELRTIVSRLPFIEKDKVLKQLRQIADSV